MGKAKIIGSGGGGINIKNGLLMTGVSKDEEIPAGMFVEKMQDVTDLSTNSTSDDLISRAHLVKGQFMEVKVPNSNIVLVHDYDTYSSDAIHQLTAFELNSNGDASNISSINFLEFDLSNIQSMFLVDNYVALIGATSSVSRTINISIINVSKNFDGNITASLIKTTILDYATLGKTGGTSNTLRQIKAIPAANNSKDMLLLFDTYYSTSYSIYSYKCVLHIELDYSVSVKVSAGNNSDKTVQPTNSRAVIFGVNDFWYCVTVNTSTYMYVMYKLSVSNDTGYITTQTVGTVGDLYVPSSSYRPVYNYSTKMLYLLGNTASFPSSGGVIYLYRVTVQIDGTCSIIDQIRVRNDPKSSIAYQICVSEDGKYVVVPTRDTSSNTSVYSPAEARLVAYTNITGGDVFPPIVADAVLENGYPIKAASNNIAVTLYGVIFKNITDYKTIIYSVCTHDNDNVHIEKYLLSDEYLQPAITTVSGVTKTKITNTSAGKYYVPILNQEATAQAIREYNETVVTNALEDIKSQAMTHYEIMPNDESEVANE